MTLPLQRSTASLSLRELRGNLENLCSFRKEELYPDEYGRVLYSGGLQSWRLRFYYSGPNGKLRLNEARTEAIRKTWEAVYTYEACELSPREVTEFVTFYTPFIRKNFDIAEFRISILRGETLRRMVRRRELEQISGLPFPEEDFSNFVKEKGYSIKLKHWFDRLNACALNDSGSWARYSRQYGSLSLTLFLRVMEDAVPADKLEHLLWRLYRRKVVVLNQPDLRYLEKRSEWINAGRVPGCTLLDEYPSPLPQERRFGASDGRMVQISDHHWRLRFSAVEWKKRWIDSREEKNLGPPPIGHISQYGTITPEGVQIAITPTMLENVSISTRIELFVELVKDMMKNHYTPSNLDGRDIWFYEGKLLTIQALEVDSFNILRIIYVLRQVFTEKVHFKMVMEDSGLAKAPELKYFDNVIFTTCKHLRYSPQELSLKMEPGASAIARSSSWIYNQASFLSQEVNKLLQFLGKDIAKHGREVSLAAIRIYNEEMLFGEFPEEHFPKVLEVAKDYIKQVKEAKRNQVAKPMFTTERVIEFLGALGRALQEIPGGFARQLVRIIGKIIANNLLKDT